VSTSSLAPKAITAFDIVAQPDAIAVPWGFLAIFWVAGVVLVLIAILAWGLRWRPWRRVYYTLFALFWWAMVAYATWTETGLASRAREAARNGSYQTVEGCLSSFQPGEAGGGRSARAEAWEVGGERFQYGAGEVGFAWHRVEPAGGVVHADSRVSVAFIRDETYGENKILRLVVIQHACPRAAEPGLPS